MKMNNEKYNQIIDEAYENYVKFILSTENQNNKWEIVKIPGSKEIFIKTAKSDDEIVKKMGKKYCEKFSEIWGLKIEERGLDMMERWAMAGLTPNMTEFDYCNQLCDEHNVPTKLITITYNNETVEFYE